MFFKRKPRNRRLGREYVLDVKLRSSQVRAARTRLVTLALGAVFAVVFGVYLLWRGGDWALDRLVYENKAFAIQEIDVQTDGIIAVDQLRRWAGVRPGQNLFALDLARVKRDLELVSLVQSASVERVLPHILCIRVVEREPLAQINVPRPSAGGGVTMAVFQLDADGYVILPLDPRQCSTPQNQPPEQLPVISGVDGNELQPGRRLEGPQIQAALQLVRAFEQSPMAALVDLQRIDLSAPDVLVVTTGQGSEITFGLTSLDQQIWRWHSIFESAQKVGKAIGTLDLAVRNNLPAHWLEASAVPPATPKFPKLLHNKKKHV
jgi:cell division septal protein FtsQ